jgi:hypothetical protein
MHGIPNAKHHDMFKELPADQLADIIGGTNVPPWQRTTMTAEERAFNIRKVVEHRLKPWWDLSPRY